MGKRWSGERSSGPHGGELQVKMKQGFVDAKAAYERKVAEQGAAIGPAVEPDVEDAESREMKDVREEGEEDAMTKLANNYPTAITEHLYQQDERWEDCARLFCFDPNTHLQPNEIIRLFGSSLDLKPCQIFRVFVCFEMEVFQNGGYLADTMGLGKVIK